MNQLCPVLPVFKQDNIFPADIAITLFTVTNSADSRDLRPMEQSGLRSSLSFILSETCEYIAK